MEAALEIQLIAAIVAVACALPGTFLVLRKMSMMSDSITHTILLGIVLAFFVTHDLSSPFLILGAALIGVVTVWLTETVTKTKLVSEDSAIGIVFPLLFSIAIILITRYAGSVHLDTDSVLLGELAFAPFDRMIIFGVDIGARSIYTSGGLLLINLLFISIFYKELKIATFDPMLATVLGFSPVVLHYSLMALVSFTTVGAFESVGSVLVVAFMIGPPITAYLLTDKLKQMLWLSAIFGAASGILGYQLASVLDVSIAGSMAVVTGLLFLVSFIFSPKKGFIFMVRRRQYQRKAFAQATLLMHICHHRNTPFEKRENTITAIPKHLHWSNQKSKKITDSLLETKQLKLENNILIPTEKGLEDSKNIEKTLLRVR